MLYQYLQDTQRLLHDARDLNYNTGDLTRFINIARGQMAGEAECIPVYATLALTNGVNVYAFSAIVLGGASGVQNVLNVRQSSVEVAFGQTWMRPRSFQWLSLYGLNEVVPVTGQPKVFAQYGQGVSGSLFIYPTPDTSYTLKLDTVCLPNALVLDTDPEAIPYPWTDAVPYFAAYLAYLNAQQKDPAQEMYQLYEVFTKRARAQSNPSVLPGIYSQGTDPVQNGRFGGAQ